jgi:hypothetical protein
MFVEVTQCCGSGSGSGTGFGYARIRNFLQNPDPELEVIDQAPDPELDLNLIKGIKKLAI